MRLERFGVIESQGLPELCPECKMQGAKPRLLVIVKVRHEGLEVATRVAAQLTSRFSHPGRRGPLRAQMQDPLLVYRIAPMR